MIIRSLILVAIVVAFVSTFAASVSAQRKPVVTPVIQGSLIKSDKRPLQYTEIELVPVESNEIVNDQRLFGISDSVGRFRFNEVPAGKYTLSINFGDKPTFLSPFETFFYPGTTKRSEASVLTIDEGTKLAGLVFSVRKELTKGSISGRISWPDGRPVQGAIIVCRDLEFEVKNSFGGISSDKDGKFSFEAFVGRKYQLGVVLFDRDIRTPWERGNIIGIAESGEFVLESKQHSILIQLVKPEEVRTFTDKYLS